MNTKVATGAALFVCWAFFVAVIIAFLLTGNKASPLQSGTAQGTTQLQQSNLFDKAELQNHSTASDCWILIGSIVYDLTSYIPLHPGGTAVIIPYCGKNATRAFATKDKNPGVSHSQNAVSLLDSYYVGDFAKALPAEQPPAKVVSPISLAPNATSVVTNISVASNNTRGITVDSLGRHNSAASCWILIDKTVYDVTSYLPIHPGSATAILPYCGGNATKAFATKDKTPGNGHSQAAHSLLNAYYVGELGATVAVTAVVQPLSLQITSPTGVIAQGTTQVSITAYTDRDATCKWDTVDMPYIAMSHTFLNTGGKVQADTFTGLSDGASYRLYVRCMEMTGTVMLTSISTSFSVKAVAALTPDQVSLHNTQSGCWLIINGNVYDVTGYIPLHPGGAATIVPNCGQESTIQFTTKAGSGTHSSNAKSLLNNYLLGALANPAQLPPSAAITAPQAGQQFPSGTSQVTLSSTTDKAANCRYALTDTPYASMSLAFSTSATTSHSTALSGLTDGSNYAVYVRCDSNGLSMTTSASVAFSVASASFNATMNSSSNASSNVSGIALAQLALHSTQQDCWLLVSGKVYDVTNYIPIHPGGVATIATNCGKESTNTFNTRGGTGSHSSNARNLLNGYFIGNITVTMPTANMSNGTNSTPANSTTPSTSIMSVTGSGVLSPATLTIHAGDTVTFSYSGSGDEILLAFSPHPPSYAKLDHEFTQYSYTFTSPGTYTLVTSRGSATGTIIVQ